jgi:hypothetical protein
MYKELLRSITGVQVFPIVSLCLFVSVFVFAIIRAYQLDARRVSELANLPFEGEGDGVGSQATPGKGAQQ